MLQIYGVPFSAHTRKVIVAAHHKRLPFELSQRSLRICRTGFCGLAPSGRFRWWSTGVARSPTPV